MTRPRAPQDPVLVRLKAALKEAYGERFDRMLLVGTLARPDFGPGADYDVAVFLHRLDSRWEEMSRLADVTTKVLIQTTKVISAKAYDVGTVDPEAGLGTQVRKRAARGRDRASHLERARREIASGRFLLSGGFLDQAALAAYRASLHAAQALTMVRTGRELASERSVRAEFARLARGESGVPEELAAVPALTYDVATSSGYDTDTALTEAEAKAALDLAQRLLEAVAAPA